MYSSKLLAKTLARSPSTRRSYIKSYSSASPECDKSLILYNSLTSKYECIPSNISWYTCGPTVYDSCHLGHARTYVLLDIIRRLNPNTCFHIMNVTDVDDKIIARAKSEKQDPMDLARRFEDEFWNDMKSLGVLPPHMITRVSEHVESSIIPYIQKIIDREKAYVAEDGVYFSVPSVRYGKLAPSAAAQNLFPIEQSVSKSKKRNPKDFALWKFRKEGENIFWDSPWGEGRPGWHIECSAMIDYAMEQLPGVVKGVHAGGIDLKFPHHVNEMAQAEAYHGIEHDDEKEWIPQWVHTGHLHIEGQKMSKSLKNFITVRSILQSSQQSPFSSPADDFRLWCLALSGHYRQTATFKFSSLEQAKISREKIINFLIEAEDWIQRQSNNKYSNRKWDVKEQELFQFTNQQLGNANQALLGNIDPGYDLDGSKFFSNLKSIIDFSTKYMRSTSTSTVPIECLSMTVSSIRSLLRNLGFSSITVDAGIPSKIPDFDNTSCITSSGKVVDEMVNFRSAVRNIALKNIKDENDTIKECSNEIMEACDFLRDEIVPNKLGVKIFDGHEEEKVCWRWSMPQSYDNLSDDLCSTKGFIQNLILDSSSKGKVSDKKDVTYTDTNDLFDHLESKHKPNNEHIPYVKDFFRLGKLYENQFSKFDDKGIPLKWSDGSEISEKKLEKLLKKKDKYKLKLAKVHSWLNQVDKYKDPLKLRKRLPDDENIIPRMEDLFVVAQWKNKFSEYNYNHMPTKYANGKHVIKRHRQLHVKRKERYRVKLDKIRCWLKMIPRVRFN